MMNMYGMEADMIAKEEIKNHVEKDMLDDRLSIQEEQEEFIRDFNELDDWMFQYSCLLELTADMEPLKEEEKSEENLISGCQAKLWIVLSCEDGVISVRADSEALIVKGIVAVIVALFHGHTPREICDAKIDFLERTSLKQQISTDRFAGMQSVIQRIQEFAGKYL